jgi:hypothetical protein
MSSRTHGRRQIGQHGEMLGAREQRRILAYLREVDYLPDGEARTGLRGRTGRARLFGLARSGDAAAAETLRTRYHLRLVG